MIPFNFAALEYCRRREQRVVYTAGNRIESLFCSGAITMSFSSSFHGEKNNRVREKGSKIHQ